MGQDYNHCRFRWTDHLKQSNGGADRAKMHRGFWLRGTLRLMLSCRLFGHRAVVDGTEPLRIGRGTEKGARWVVCDRCGTRAEPQGTLAADEWNIGDLYTGPMTGRLARKGSQEKPTATREPGPWPDSPRGVIGAELVVGRSVPGWSAEVKVGNAGSEHTLAAHLQLYPFGALYLHTEDHGQGLQRRLNLRGYESRVTGADIQFGRLSWSLWAKRDSASENDPRWQHGSIKLDPRDALLGQARYRYENVGGREPGTVRMAHGDDHDVTLQLQRQSYGRDKRRKRVITWVVDIDVPPPGIETRSDRAGWGGGTTGFAVEVSAVSVERGTWKHEALANAAARLTADRARSIYLHETESVQ